MESKIFSSEEHSVVCGVCIDSFETNSAEERSHWGKDYEDLYGKIVSSDQGYTMTHVCARYGHCGCLEKLCFENNFRDIHDRSNKMMFTPLHLAVSSQHIPVINFLLRNGASLTIDDRNFKKVTDSQWFQEKVREGKIIIPSF